MLHNQAVDSLGGSVVVEIAALHGQTLEEGTDETQKYLQFRNPDEIDGLTIGL